MFVEHNNPLAKAVIEIARKAFPEYTGNKFRLEVTDKGVNCASYWEGGSRDYFRFVNLHKLHIEEAPAQSAFDKHVPELQSVIPTEFMHIVKHTIFMGRDMGLTVYVNPVHAGIYKKPESTSLTNDEKIVLFYTRSLKASYGGISNFRYHQANKEHKITLDAWNSSKQALQNKGLMMKNGALTTNGKNEANALGLTLTM